MQTGINLLKQSDFFQMMSARLYFNEQFNDADLQTYARIVSQAARVANRKLGAKFVIVYWDEDDDAGRRVLNRLEKTQLPLIRVSTIIPRHEWTRVRFPGDLHPGPEADRRIAQALASTLTTMDGQRTNARPPDAARGGIEAPTTPPFRSRRTQGNDTE
jgi:hypothetical protein